MKRRSRAYLIPILAALILFLGGCNALKRGDFLQQTDNTLYFTHIGFLVADNPLLSRDAITDVSGTDTNIWITVPYDADTTTALVIDFDVVGKDTQVEFEDPPGSAIFIPIKSGDPVPFFNDTLNPVSRIFRIIKKDTFTGEIDSQDIVVNVTKIIRPVLWNPPAPGDVSPFLGAAGFRFTFVDENDVIIPNIAGGSWNVDPELVEWDGWRMDFLSAPSYDAGPPEGYLADVHLLFPGEHWIELKDDLFSDINGYKSLFKHIEFRYEPPPVYLSKSGDNTDDGLTPSTPVLDWHVAYGKAQAAGISDIYIEASDIPYDVAGADLIEDNWPIVPVNIFGSWKPGFTARYDEDWDERPPTILSHSGLSHGTVINDPEAVLTYQNVSSDFVLDGISIQPRVVANYATALKIDASDLRINDCQFSNPLDTSIEATAVTVTDFSGPSKPQFRESVFIGKAGGTNSSTGLRTLGSDVELGGCLILAGDLSGSSTGIEGTDSSINIGWSYILAGVIDPEDNTFTEIDNRGINLTDTDLNLHNVWIHAGNCTSISEALNYQITAGNHQAWINEATLISGRANTSSIALNAINSNNGELHLFNSVLLADRALLGNSVGIIFDNMNNSQIMGNAIHVRNGITPAISYGILFSNSAGTGTDVRNNLIWSDTSGQTLGIMADFNMTASPIHVRHNDFWNTGGAAELDLGDGGGPKSIKDAHAEPNFYGNIGISADMDITYDYATGQIDMTDVGRVIGTPPTDIMFGGEDLSGIAEYPEESAGDKRDRRWIRRTGYAGVGWSIGPYEYDSGSFPQVIHVSSLGDDSHPLGTSNAPFESLPRAYDIARTAPAGTIRTDAMEIRVSEGIYDMNNPFMPDIDTGPDLAILGGYDKNTWARNPAANVTELFRDTGADVLCYDGNGTTQGGLLEGFTLRNSMIGASVVSLRIQGRASPEIRNNIIIGGSSGFDSKAIVISDEANPVIVANQIFTGTNSIFSNGIEIVTAGAEIYNNVIHSGAATLAGDTIGINFISNDISPDFNPVNIFNNTIFGGAGGISSTGIQSSDDNLYVVNNLLIAGPETPGAGYSYGYRMNGMNPDDTAKMVSNNLFLFGTSIPDRHAIMILGNIWDTVAGMENELTVTYSRVASGNLMDGTSSPSAYFIDFVPDMTEAGFLAENWGLIASGPENARTGGMDLSDHFSIDKDGDNRSVPWSIGAYEY